MKASKVVITEDTMREAMKPLSPRKKGELYKEKLREIGTNGKLQMCRRRADVALAVGYPYAKRYTSGANWVLRQIHSGVLKETLVKYTNDGRGEYEYQYIEPKPKKPFASRKRTIEPLKTESKVAEPQTILDNLSNDMAVVLAQTTLTIYQGDTTIVLESIDKDTAVAVIKSVIGKE